MVVDTTNPTPAERAPLVTAARAAGVAVRAVWLATPPATCAARNDARTGRARVPPGGLPGHRAAVRAAPGRGGLRRGRRGAAGPSRGRPGGSGYRPVGAAGARRTVSGTPDGATDERGTP
nr:AAA family ATPase [Geodermatophilus sp. LHW52908]